MLTAPSAGVAQAIQQGRGHGDVTDESFLVVQRKALILCRLQRLAQPGQIRHGVAGHGGSARGLEPGQRLHRIDLGQDGAPGGRAEGGQARADMQVDASHGMQAGKARDVDDLIAFQLHQVHGLGGAAVQGFQVRLGPFTHRVGGQHGMPEFQHAARQAEGLGRRVLPQVAQHTQGVRDALHTAAVLARKLRQLGQADRATCGVESFEHLEALGKRAHEERAFGIGRAAPALPGCCWVIAGMRKPPFTGP